MVQWLPGSSARRSAPSTLVRLARRLGSLRPWFRDRETLDSTVTDLCHPVRTSAFDVWSNERSRQ